MTSLEQRVQALEDVHAISNLKAQYLHAANGGWDRASHDGDRISALFVEDGIWELTGIAAARGKADIRQTFYNLQPVAPFALHLASNPFIEVSGNEGRGTWYLIALSNSDKDEDVVTTVYYDDRFIRQGSGWLFKSLIANVIFQGPIRRGGWSEFIKQHGKPFLAESAQRHR